MFYGRLLQMYAWRARGKHSALTPRGSAADLRWSYRPVCAMSKSVIVSVFVGGDVLGYHADIDLSVEPRYFYDCRTPLRRTHSPSPFNHWRQTATPGKRYNSPNGNDYLTDRASLRGGPPSSAGEPEQDAMQESLSWDANPQSCVTGCGCVCNDG